MPINEANIVAQASSLRAQAIERRNSDFAPTELAVPQQCSHTNDISVQPDRGMWALVFIPLFVAVIALEMINREIPFLWWVPPSVLFTGLLLSLPFRCPREVVFRAENRTMELRYRFWRPSKFHSFEDLESIHSYIKESGENSTYIQLEVRLKNTKRIGIKMEEPSWENAGFFGWKDCQEPQSLANLRRQIASLAGIKDLGFIGRQQV
jgi:hypothetical protein